MDGEAMRGCWRSVSGRLWWGMHNHEKLDVWHRALALSITICRAIAQTRIGKHRALLHQLERSITSVPANIAEGSGQSTDVKFAHFVSIAIGSVTESMSHLAQIEGLGLLPREDVPAWRAELKRIRRMSESLQRSLLNGDLEHYRSPLPTPRSKLSSPESPVRGPRSRSST